MSLRSQPKPPMRGREREPACTRNPKRKTLVIRRRSRPSRAEFRAACRGASPGHGWTFRLGGAVQAHAGLDAGVFVLCDDAIGAVSGLLRGGKVSGLDSTRRFVACLGHETDLTFAFPLYEQGKALAGYSTLAVSAWRDRPQHTRNHRLHSSAACRRR